VEGQLVRIDARPGAYRVTGDLVGTYQVVSEKVTTTWIYEPTSINVIKGTGRLSACVDRNHNKSCDRGEPSNVLRFDFERIASFNLPTGRLIESNWVRLANSGTGGFVGGLFTLRDVPVGNSDEIESTYQGDLRLKRPAT
jgi:hypothetical protein